MHLLRRLAWFGFLSLWCIACLGGNTNGVSEPLWQTEFMGRTDSVLSETWSLVPDVRVCVGLPKSGATLAALVTAIHHDAIGKRSVCGRLSYTGMALSRERLFQEAEWIKGEPLKADEQAKIGRLCDAYIEKHREIGFFTAPAGGTMFTGQALILQDAVFGWRYDIPKAVQRLEEKNGWRMDVERCEAPTADWLRRALNRKCVPILETRNPRWGTVRLVNVIGICANATGEFLVSIDPVLCGVGSQSYFEICGGEPWDKLLAPPGSASWVSREGSKREMWPADRLIRTSEELPPGCQVEPFVAEKWTATVVKELRPAWTPWRVRIQAIVVTNTPEQPSATTESVSKDAERWSAYFAGKETFGIGAPCDLIGGVRCCPSGDGVTPLAAAMATVVFRSFPDGLKLVQDGPDWRRVVRYTCEERWRTMSAGDRANLYQMFNEVACNLSGSRTHIEYIQGKRLWSLDEEGARELRVIFAQVTNGLALGPVMPVPGRTPQQQAILRLVTFDDSADPVAGMIKRMADRYGWAVTVESTDKPTFAMFKKSVEMEVPVLVRQGNGGWVVVVGFLSEGGDNYLLVVDPGRVQAEPCVEGASVEEHEERMALAVGIPGRVKYEKAAEKGHFVTDRLLDTRRVLPLGCGFVKVGDQPIGTAYFIHDWRQVVCCKAEIDELLQRTKAVSELPPPPPGHKSWRRWNKGEQERMK